MLPGLFGSTTIDCCAGMEKGNTPETADATGVIVAIEPVSDNGCRPTNDRALGGNLRCSFRTQVGHRARSEKGPGGDLRQSLSARLCTPRPVTIRVPVTSSTAA